MKESFTNSTKIKMALTILSLCMPICLVTQFTGHVYAGEQSTASHTKILEEVRKYGREFAIKPTDAKVDRVWRAIPGLAGWQLNEGCSVQETEKERNGSIHLCWRQQLPQVRLASLPAEPIYRGPSTEKSAALMINVSWGEEYVPQMLNILKKENVKATFFLDGAWVKKHVTLARNIVEEGHAIGSHGMGHPDFIKLSDQKLAAQLDATNAVLFQKLGVAPTYIAPPSGAFDQRLLKMTKDRKMYTILWTVDTVDWQRPEPSVIIDRVRQKLVPGSLILMHPTASTVAALPQLIGYLHHEGYITKTLDEVIAEKPLRMPPTTLHARA